MKINIRRERSRKVGRAIMYASFVKHFILFAVFAVQGWLSMSALGAFMMILLSTSMYLENIEKRKFAFYLVFFSIVTYWLASEIMLGTQYGYHQVVWPLIVVMVLMDVLNDRSLYVSLFACMCVVIISTLLPKQGLLIEQNVAMPVYNICFLLVSCFTLIPVILYFHRSNLSVLNQLQEQANTDDLTGLYNRRRMLEDIRLQQALCERNDSDFALILGDIDLFKKLNDTYGHAAGDAGLVHLSKLLKCTVRKTDSVSRWGGEEFLILLSGTDEYEACKIANNIRELVENHPFSFEDKSLSLTLSFGVAHYKMGQAIERTIHNADLALYEAKSEGRNRVILHRPSISNMPESKKVNEKYFQRDTQDEPTT